MPSIDFSEPPEDHHKFRMIQNRGYELFVKKNKDYGNAYKDFGATGVLIRMNDKIKRFISVSNNGVSLVQTESLKDTLIDLQNYSTMAIMLLEEEESRKS